MSTPEVTRGGVRQVASPAESDVLVSVVIPCLNEAANIEQCVTRARAVLGEHDLRGEVVVAIGGPTGPGYAISFDQFGFAAPSSAGEGSPGALATAAVAFPNPTSGAATVAFELARASDVTVDVVDLLGRRVARLGTTPQAAGDVRLALPTASLAPGLYLVRVQTEAGVATTRLTVTR